MAAKLHNKLAEIPTEERDMDEIKDGYQLKFVGKDYAKLQAGLKTETIITPDFEHNAKPENQNSENIFITGDNLDALKHLENAYSGKVDVIYIDPPYNTGNDGFVYADNFKFSDEELKEKLGLTDTEISRVRALNGKSSHSAWLTFMLPRLMIAKRLLSDTGVIFISIDDNEQASLKNIMDEIFGERSFICLFNWQTKKAAQGMTTENMVVPNTEYILCYAKNRNLFRFKGIKRTGNNGFSNPDNDPRGLWKRQQLQRFGQGLSVKKIINPDTGDVFEFETPYTEEKINKWISENRIIFPEDIGKFPVRKEFLNEYENDQQLITALGLFATKATTQKLYGLFDNAKIFTNPKPDSLIKFLAGALYNKPEGNLILDFFAGSATTADAVMQLNKEDGGNRKYILVQLPEKVSKNSEAEKAGYKTIDQISRERIIRAAAKIGDNSGFKHFRLTTPNDENALLKLEEFDPNAIVAFPEDMTTTFEGGEKAILQTWLIDDGFEFNQTPKIVEFAGYQAHYIEQRLYLISTGWSSEATRELLNAIGKNKLAVQSIVIFPYSFAFNELNELKINLRTAFEKSNKIELLERY
jgi:site-specific DNA-methyltransferase (adenine-specific)